MTDQDRLDLLRTRTELDARDSEIDEIKSRPVSMARRVRAGITLATIASVALSIFFGAWCALEKLHLIGGPR
jgi:hypothetical protein